MIEIKEVEALAGLARLSLTDSEKAKLHQDLESILGYISELNKAPTLVVAKQDLGLVKNVWREDENINERKSFTAKILADAPRTKNGYFEVKKILDTNFEA
ncbi:MAG: hypothetical protein A2571_03030 [Candidatus Vogelbacteria bacterium RIFOXYD1_FULL_44_32]|uniref:Aspartyl/glutamyl-tRNA(Asn/Gln) amidotransferase subunit C n=1 Tax=Candidatus Vogelbacteria bacterium RIFOXYD1_FULL_44_32 TaxID=1802438 RepID=A0A1G2QCC0_9BACT|nr:MAG: hypothetical protein A2571_03030 [Candidatus Vogelbacteria bacterium RIFOXYD1_FULL_44_32]